MSAAVQVAATVTTRDCDLHLDVPAGSTLAVVGPNGAGKSTLLQLVGGQLHPDTGHVRIGGEEASGPTRHVPVHRRRIAVLEQRALLFEHLSVLDNVAFGLRARGVRSAEARARARAELDAVGCGDLAANRAWEVSGGQAQRIALARALATDPRVVLLDEPLAALDVTVAPAIRTLLRERLRGAGLTALVVTHDAIDALSLAEHLAVVEGGRVTDHGPVTDLLARPRTAFVADLVGVNLLVGTVAGPDALSLPGGAVVTGVAQAPLATGAPGFASFTPTAVAVHAVEPTGSPRNHLPASIRTVEPRGASVRLGCALSDGTPVAAEVTAASVVAEGFTPGRDVWLAVKAVQVGLYPR